MKRKAWVSVFSVFAAALVFLPAAAYGMEANEIPQTGGGQGTIYGVIVMVAAAVALVVLAVVSIWKRKKK